MTSSPPIGRLWLLFGGALAVAALLIIAAVWAALTFWRGFLFVGVVAFLSQGLWNKFFKH